MRRRPASIPEPLQLPQLQLLGKSSETNSKDGAGAGEASLKGLETPHLYKRRNRWQDSTCKQTNKPVFDGDARLPSHQPDHLRPSLRPALSGATTGNRWPTPSPPFRQGGTQTHTHRQDKISFDIACKLVTHLQPLRSVQQTSLRLRRRRQDCRQLAVGLVTLPTERNCKTLKITEKNFPV